MIPRAVPRFVFPQIPFPPRPSLPVLLSFEIRSPILSPSALSTARLDTRMSRHSDCGEKVAQTLPRLIEGHMYIWLSVDKGAKIWRRNAIYFSDRNHELKIRDLVWTTDIRRGGNLLAICR